MSNKKQIFSWSIYDLANTIFSALFITIFFPLFIILLGGTAFHVGLVFSVSMLLAAFIVPTLGAIADITKRKKLLLFTFTLICCVFTFFTGFAGLVLALILGLLANFFYHAGLDVYDAMLIDISTQKNIGRVSGIGIGIGYIGTILAIFVSFIIGRFYDLESIEGIRIIFIIVAILFLSISMITFLFYKEPFQKKKKIKLKHIPLAFKRVISSIKEIKKFKYLWIFLLASFLYSDAANTAIIFLYLYGRDQIGLTVQQFLPLYLVMALVAMIGAFIFGKITDTVGHKKTLMFLLFGWIAIISIMYFKTTYATFLLTGILGGAFLGGTWTVTRPLLVSLAPKQKISELFGYQGLTEKFGGMIGPVIFGAVASLFGFRQALLIIIGLFILGAITLGFVKIKKTKNENS